SDMLEFENYTGMVRIFHDGILTLKEVENGLGLEVVNVGLSNLNMGMDLIGGTRVLLEPNYEETNETDRSLVADRIISTLQTRMNVYGLKEINYQVVNDVEGNKYVQIEMAGASKKEIDDLLEKQGIFEGYITRAVILKNGTGGIEVGDMNYTVKSVEITEKNETGVNDTNNENVSSLKKIIIGENKIGINDTIELNGIEFTLWNITNNTVVLAGKTFTSEDIKYVYFDSQHSFLRKYGSGWEFSFQILVSDDGAERFARITEDIPIIIDPKTGESYLEQRIYLFLDDVIMDDLRISSSLAGEAYSTPQITGGGTTEKDAAMNQRRLQSVMSSGALPVDLKVVRIDSISPSLGNQFVRSILVAALTALIAVSVVVSVRYKNWKIVLPILITSISEVVIILGIASVIHWTIDLAAIAGIIAAVGTGVDHQIIITDEISLGGERVFSIKEKIKRAFFIIFGTASTTIAAMLPLGIIGIGVMRGFAITTIIGVLVGIFITRPAYSKIIEKLELV
ncbi:MAG: hypothetical protein KAT37_03280, partial [Candidatus Aenigmarchaeota archaeon]|nr:hypothetical protein [Candidatus Aenigmarchaeota archaeon]